MIMATHQQSNQILTYTMTLSVLSGLLKVSSSIRRYVSNAFSAVFCSSTPAFASAALRLFTRRTSDLMAALDERTIDRISTTIL